MAAVPRPSQRPLPVIRVRLTPSRANTRPRRAPASSSRIAGSSGAFAIVLAVEMKSLLVGESATRENVLAIRKAIESVEDVDRLIHMRTLHVGPEELLVAAKVAVDAEDDAGRVTRAINEAEERIRASVPIATLIYIEPDLFRTAPASPSSPGAESSG